MNRFLPWMSASLLMLVGCGPSAPATGHTVLWVTSPRYARSSMPTQER